MFSIHFDQLADRILRFSCFWVYFWSLSISCFQHSPSWVVCTNLFIFTSWQKLPGFAYLFIPCNLWNQNTFSSISSFYLPSISRHSYNHNACQESLCVSTPPDPTRNLERYKRQNTSCCAAKQTKHLDYHSRPPPSRNSCVRRRKILSHINCQKTPFLAV
jgi:hypothetical protein